MTDLPEFPRERIDEIAQDHANTARAGRRLHPAVTWLAAFCVLLLALLALVVMQWGHHIADQADHADRIATANADALAKANQRLQQNNIAPVPTPSGAQGLPGEKGDTGAAGRGIVSSAVSDNHLILTYTDGARVDVGPVVGPPGPAGRSGAAGSPGAPGAAGADGSAGKNGADGKNGRGIASATIDTAGHLVVAYSDGTTADLGRVVGPAGEDGRTGPSGPAGEPGRGIRSISCTGLAGAKLEITYSDGTTQTVSCDPLTEPSGEPTS